LKTEVDQSQFKSDSASPSK